MPSLSSRRIPGRAMIINIMPTTPERQCRDNPPSYDSSVRMGLPVHRGNGRENHIYTLRQNRVHTPLFSHPAPPPPYSETQWCIPGNIPVYNAASLPVIWGRRPRIAYCPSCHYRCLTRIQVQCTRATHLTSLALCLCACWPCCLLPYALAVCKSTRHHCGRCRRLLGVYDPWIGQRETELW